MHFKVVYRCKTWIERLLNQLKLNVSCKLDSGEISFYLYRIMQLLKIILNSKKAGELIKILSYNAAHDHGLEETT